MQFHTELVVQTAHDLDLLDQALLALIFRVGCLLGEGLDGIIAASFNLLGQVYRSKVALPDLLLGLELLVETSLI